MAKYEIESVSADTVVINDVARWSCESDGLKFRDKDGTIIAWFDKFEYFVRLE